MCWSESGNLCVPVSWNEVLDQRTGVREGRKVAKPF
jgi:exosome complex component CSL4